MLNGNRVPDSPTSSWLMVAFAAIIAILLPAGYFTINYSALASATQTEAEIQADAISQIVIGSPELWRFQEHRLGDLLLRGRRGAENVSARILDRDGAQVVSVGQPLGVFALRRSAGVFDSGVRLGQVEHGRSLWDLFLETAGVALLGALLGIGVFALLRGSEHLRLLARTDLVVSEEKFRQMAENIQEVFWLADSKNNTMLYVSPAYENIWGRSRDAVYASSQDWIEAIHPEDRERVLHAALREQTAGTYDREYRIVRPDGTLRWIYEKVVPVRAATGDVYRQVGIAEDITERKRAEQEIRDLNASLEQRVAERTAQLEEASRAKSDFLATMSHELRTPLNSIIGFSEMLKDGALGELDPKQRGFVGDIFDAGAHLLALINDILDLSKVEAGMMSLEPGVVEVAELLKASTLIVREKACAHRIRLDTRLDPALGAMLADERKLKQIVYNLLANAVKFTPEGGAVTLSARRCTRAEVTLDSALPGRLVAPPPGDDGEFVEISVSDTGIGVAEEHLPKLFEPFVQVDSSLARRHAGTGLGLVMVRRLAALHGGTVGVASRPGTGSRFSVWLPYRAAASAAQEAELRRALDRRPTDGKDL